MDAPKQKGRKRVLIINYYWPPCGGVGVLRTLKFAKFLRDFGWEPVIYTAENATYPSLDDSNNKDIPANLEVIRQPIIEPHGLYAKLNRNKGTKANDVFYTSEAKPGMLSRLSVWVRANMFIPDARALWIRPSVKYLKRYLKEHPVDAILSSGPPQTNTRIATLLKKELQLPWLADWRDPWTQVDYYRSLPLTDWADRRHKKWEKEALQLADATTIVSSNWAKDLESIGGQNVHVITNGFDPEDFTNLEPTWHEQFTITHLGILGNDRIPEGFLKAAGSLAQENAAFNEHFLLQLIGQVSPHLIEQAKAAGLQDKHLRFTGNLPRSKALQLAAGSDLNLLLLNKQPNAAGRIPFKLFEYLAIGRPIQAYGPIKSDVGEILKKTKAGQIHLYENETAAKSILEKAFDQYKQKRLETPNDLALIEAYAFKSLTARIAALLDSIVTKGQ